MKLAFLIDNPQTVQTVLTVLIEASYENNECVVYSTTDERQLDFLNGLSRIDEDGRLRKNHIRWISHRSREDVRNQVLGELHEYDAVLGINVHSPIWQGIYVNNRSFLDRAFGAILLHSRKRDRHRSSELKSGIGQARPLLFGLEHCWNEIYHLSAYAYTTKSTRLFCNSQISLQMLLQLGAPDYLLECQGSPWLEACDRFGKRSRKENLVVLLAPHTSWVNQIPGLAEYVNDLLPKIRTRCDQAGWRLVLKNRDKYTKTLDEALFDEVVNDQLSLEHIDLYSRARVAMHFCSSSACEFAFTRTFAVSMLPSHNLEIHSGNKQLRQAKALIHEKYYNTDGYLNSNPFATYFDRGMRIEPLLDNLMDQQNDDLDWTGFQRRFFPSERPHEEAGRNVYRRVVELVEG